MATLDLGGSPDTTSHGGPMGPSRRDVLRWFGAVGAATVVPFGLSACEPVRTDPPLPPDPSVRPLGFVGGQEAVVGQGGWCWFQAPRTSFGPGGVLWMGSSVSSTGTDLDGTVQAKAVDIASLQVVHERNLAKTRVDDHTSPSVLALGDGVQIAWGLHQFVDFMDIAADRVGGPYTVQRIKRPGSIKSPARGMSYASAHIVDGQRWILYRGEQFSWNLLTSPDGVAWTARGLVVAPATLRDRPYVHAASDGKRLHITVSDSNPTEYQGTSVYAGTIDADLTIRTSNGGANPPVVGRVGPTAPRPRQLTRLVAGIAGSPDTEADDSDVWISDLQVIDGRPTATLSVRDAWQTAGSQIGAYRHRYLWARQRSTGWVIETLGWAGGELSTTQPDYSGLAAQDLSESRRVVISTNVHPVHATPLVSNADGLVHFELFEGYRVAEGRWRWTPLTANSTEDNVRPTIAAGGPHKALSWMRGRYWSWTSFNTRIVVRRAAPAA